MKRKFFMLLLVLTNTIAASSQQAVYNYYPRIVMGSTVEQVKQKMKGYSGYKFDKETIMEDFHLLTYVKSNGMEMLFNFDSKGKLYWMTGIDVSSTEFKNTINQLRQELKAAGKDAEGMFVESRYTGAKYHLFDLSETNVAKFTLYQNLFTGGYRYSIEIIDKGLKEGIIKDAK